LAAALLALLPMGAWAADPQITSLTDTPDPATAGGLYTYAIGIDNTDASDATNTVVTLSVPAGATFVSASPTNANCVATSATLVTCSVGTLAGNGTGARTVNFTWRATAAGTISATATITADSDSNLGNNTQNATTTVLAGADLRLTKTDSPDPVVGGANVTYTLTASNDGPNASGNLVLTDNLPGSSTFVSASGTGWSCSHAAGVVTCTRNGPLAVGASAPPVTIVARIVASTGFVTNSATISPAIGAVADPDNSNNTATATTQVLPGADVRIDSKGVSPNPVIAGENATFTITPRNGGPAIANTVAVTDTLPSGWTFVSATGTGWSCAASGQTVTCSRATYAVGATNNITLVATAPTNAVIGPTGRTDTNTATITTTDNDPNPANNSSGVTFDILPDGADLRLAKSKSPNPVAQGSQVTSTITVTNGGPRRATGPLRVVDQLTGETYVSESGTGWTCSVSGSTVTCDHPNAAGLNAGASLPTLTIITTATVAGSATNQACTGSSLPGGAAGATARQPLEGDPNPTNDCNSASTSSTSVRPDLAITKTTSTPTGGDKIVSATEDRVTYTLVVTNVSPTAENATGVRISDTVPAFLTSGAFPSSITPVVATVAGVGSTATFNCAVSSATVICTQTGGVLAQGGTVTVPITVVRGLLAGDFTNSSTVENTVEGDPDRSNNTATDTVTIAPLADMQMTGKSITPGTVKAGEVATYVLSFRNNGPSTAQNVVVTDIFTFPAGDTGYTVTQITPSKGSCAFYSGTNPNGVGVDDVLGPARNSFTCQIGNMASGETQTVTLKGRPNFQAGNAARVFTNVVNVTTTTPERSDGTDGGNNAQGPVTLNVDPASLDLLVNKDDTGFDPIAFTSGSTFLNYRVNATNNGPSYATGVKITETMTPPAGKRIRFVCDTTTFGGSTCNTGPLALCSVSDVTSGAGTAIPAFTCDVPPGNATTGLGKGDLAIGQTKSIFLRFEVLDNPSTTGDTFTNQAIVSANEPDTLAANDTESEQTTVRRRVDLAVTKAAKKAGAPITTVALREPFEWEVVVTNNGPSESLQTILTDTLPAGSDIVGVISWTKTLPAATGTCPDSGVCTMGQLDAGGQITITVPTRLSAYPSGGVATNSATVNTDPTNLGGIDTTPLDNTATANVNVTRASIAGTVFQDRVRDGANGGTPQAAAQEPRIQGVTLTLTGNDLFGDPVNATATTDANGNYLFNNLPPSSTGGVGGYTITQTQPAGFINGTVDPPTAGGSEPSNGGPYTRGGTSGNSLFANIVVDGDDAAIRYHFPEIKQPSVSGFVYLDVNANDVRDPATDTGISGATVRLLNATTLAQIATTTTGADGAYAFTGLDPLVAYTLEQPLPTTLANLRNGAVNPGQIGGAACTTGCTAQPNTPAADTDRIADIDLASGADGTVFNFGERQLAGVSGLVYVDKNRNNALDGSDTGRLAGVTVRLVQGASCAAGTELQSTTTAVDGSYAFSGVLAFQNYLICETQPVGYAVGNANGTAGSNQITLTNLAAAGSANNNFGALVGSLAGSVYQDTGAGTLANFNNGLRDAGEAGIAGVTVTLTGTDAAGAAVNRTATTDASGNYSFDDLLAAGAGGYTVTEGAIPPSAGSFNDGKTTAGAAGGTATAVDTLPSAISGIALGAGVQTTNYIFGELPRAGITGTVYTDRNRNDTMDATPTDGRIAGVTLTLRDGSVCSAGTVLGTTTTGADGTYSFSGIAGGGTYTICETQPTGYADGTVNPGTSGTSSAANSITLTNLPSSGSADNNFGERVGSLAGSVYVDFSAATPANTNNGIRDAGEAGIAGVTVTLTGTDAAGGAVNRTAATDASGNYSFDDLLAAGAGGYTVTEGTIPPSAGSFNDGKTTAGAAGGTATAVDTLPSAISNIALGAGVQTTGYIFGELPRAGITGTVYIDRNRNDTMDPVPTDGRITGVTLTLRQGASCSAGTVLGTATTNADGNYAFNDLSAGLDYAVCETQPTGYESGATNPGTNGTSGGTNAITITNLPSTGSADNNFGERVGSLAGSVYQDTGAGTAANFNNGIRDAGELGIAGVTITLTGTDAAGGAVNRTATTDASGNYLFDDLLTAGAGGYTVTEGAIPPAAGTFLDGKTTAGAAGGTATAVNTLPSAISAINLGAGVQTTGYIFGELPNGSISGTVYIDRNRNDTIDPTPTDGRVAGVTMTLREGTSCSAGTVLGTTTTAADGTYTFGGIAGGGTYTICETQPTGYASGATNPGTNGTSGGTNAITITNLPSTGSADNHFGERVGSLAGSVYMDTNNDGQKQAGEPGLAGVVVTLTGTDATGGAVNRTAMTDANGDYRFDDLLAAGAGGYTVTEQATQPTFEGKATINGRTTAGTTGGSSTAVTMLPSAISAIPLTAGADSAAHLFGELLSVGLSGTVFADLANDGVQQLPADLGLAGVTIDLTGADDLGAAVSATTTTAADGTYSFTGLRPGTYTVTEPTQPAGTVNGITTAGSTGGTATPVATLPSVISAIPLVTSGAFSTGNNFAEIPNNSGIGGRVWLDADNDGVIDAGESGIAGVTVTLTGTDTIGRPVERTLTTDAQGGYLFENLAPGSYTVTEPTQPSGTLNGRTNAGNGGGAATPVATLPSAISGITLGIGQMVTANDFGEIPPARIAGRVYADNNDNGVIDSSETGLAGVSLVLTGSDDLGAAVNLTLSSGADGGYAFENLRPGTYTVTEPTQPPGTVNGITTAGSQGGTATPVSTLPSAISGIVLPVGGAATGNNFGELANSPDLRVTKTHAEPVFTVTKLATYSIRVLNLGEIATSGPYTIEDRLPAGLTLTSTPTGAGWSCTGAAGASSFSCTASTVVAAGATNPNAITAIAIVGAAALNAPIANNAVLVEGGGEIPARRPTPAERDVFNNNPGALPECTVAPARNACRDPEDVQQSANLSGTVWYDIGTVQRQLDSRDQPKQGWIVEVIDVNGVDPSRPNAAGERVPVASATGGEGDARVTGGTPGAVVARAFTKADGSYLIENLIPNVDYSIRFRDPNSNVVFGYPINGDRGPGSSGAQCLDRNKPINLESSCVDTGAVPQLTVRLAPGRNLVQQSLPIDPTGVVYDSGLRTPIPGATVTLAPVGACAAWDPSDDIVGATLGGYSVSGNGISMVTGADGLYQFLLSPSAPARCTFALTVTPPSGYSFISKLIAPTPGPVSPPGGPGSFFNVQPQADAPTGPVGPATTYYLSLSAGSAAPNILYNHIPLDPALPGTVLLDKTGDRSVVEVGDSVRYSITVSVPSGALPRQTTVVDRLPAGFTYIAGTATVNDRPIADPQGGVGPTLAFNLGRMGDTRQLVLRYRVRVGVGAQEGDGVNRAQAQSCGVPTGCVDAGFNPLPGSVATNEDRYRVRVTGGVFGTEACVLGKVFVDCNNNHVQDPEEIGIPGVRMVMSDGTTLISDSEGKYSVCGLEPKSTVMRVDPRTLPRGARMTTSSNRNLGDAGSLWLDLKNGELHRADFIEGSCSAPVIDQVKGRRAQGEIRAPETERPGGPALRFESDGPVIGPVRPREGERVTPVDAEPKGGTHGSP
jgi:uncharacterized repeat protein (TIGR01451 family)